MFKWLDLVTGEHHREVCRQYEIRLEVADTRVREAEDRVDQERDSRNSLERQLIENLFPARQMRPQQRPAGSAPARERIEVPIDPNDNEAILRQAARETGSRNATVVQAAAQRIKDKLMRGEAVTRPKLVENPPGAPNQEEVNRVIKEALAEAEAAGHASAEMAAS